MSIKCRSVKTILVTGLIGILLLLSFELEAKQPYPKIIKASKAAFQDCQERYFDFKSETNAWYEMVVMDTVAATISMLASPIRPIKLKPTILAKDDLSLILDGIKQFLKEHGKLFHINHKDVILTSVDDHGELYGLVFERGRYLNLPTGGKTRGQIEFLVDKSKKYVQMLVSTLTPIVHGLPDSATYSKSKIRKKLLGRVIRFRLNDKKIKFQINSEDLIQFRKVCVYEKKAYTKQSSINSTPMPLKLLRSEVHLAYEVIISNSLKKPIVKYYFDGITGKQLAFESP